MNAELRYVYGVRFGLSTADVYAGKVDELSTDDKAELERITQRIDSGMPVQYAIGRAEFCGRIFAVHPGVLIPRPETEELCEWICYQPAGSILDVGTGSGCIAITLALRMAGANVEAWDISDDCVAIAKENAQALGADIKIAKRDVLSFTDFVDGQPQGCAPIYDIIVSNPPYVCLKESKDMEGNVLDYEPHEALFVPDDDPLLFYRAIARLAVKALMPGGWLYFEINPLYAQQLADMLAAMGYADIEIKRDCYDRERFCRATLK